MSWQWRKLMIFRSTFRKSLRWTIGNGFNVSFWEDNWVYQSSISNWVTSILGSKNLSQFLITRESQWNKELLIQFVPANIFEDILKVFIPSNSLSNRINWGLTVDGEFSVISRVALLLGLGMNPP